jgi:hypothetical protein
MRQQMIRAPEQAYARFFWWKIKASNYRWETPTLKFSQNCVHILPEERIFTESWQDDVMRKWKKMPLAQATKTFNLNNFKQHVSCRSWFKTDSTTGGNPLPWQNLHACSLQWKQKIRQLHGCLQRNAVN